MSARTFFTCRAKYPDFKIEETRNGLRGSWTQFGMPFEVVGADRMMLIGECLDTMIDTEKNPPLSMMRDGVLYVCTVRSAAPVRTVSAKAKKK